MQSVCVEARFNLKYYSGFNLKYFFQVFISKFGG